MDSSPNTKNYLTSAFVQDSKRIPPYYSRPGPGQYNSISHEAISKYEKSPGGKFDQDGLNNEGIY